MRRRAQGRLHLLVIALVAATAAGCSHMPFHHPPAAAPAPPAPHASAPDGAARDSAGADTVHTPHALGLPAPRLGSKTKTPSRVISGADSTASQPAPITPVESVMTPEERQRSLARTVADTTAAGQALRKCGTRQLLPDQEGVFDAVRSLLAQTRTALQSGELWRAESLARKARQLGSSLSCP